jgi:hypothetical protein
MIEGELFQRRCIGAPRIQALETTQMPLLFIREASERQQLAEIHAQAGPPSLDQTHAMAKVPELRAIQPIMHQAQGSGEMPWVQPSKVIV